MLELLKTIRNSVNKEVHAVVAPFFNRKWSEVGPDLTAKIAAIELRMEQRLIREGLAMYRPDVGIALKVVGGELVLTEQSVTVETRLRDNRWMLFASRRQLREHLEKGDLSNDETKSAVKSLLGHASAMETILGQVLTVPLDPVFHAVLRDDRVGKQDPLALLKGSSFDTAEVRKVCEQWLLHLETRANAKISPAGLETATSLAEQGLEKSLRDLGYEGVSVQLKALFDLNAEPISPYRAVLRAFSCTEKDPGKVWSKDLVKEAEVLPTVESNVLETAGLTEAKSAIKWHTYYVDGIEYKTEFESMTGAQIKAAISSFDHKHGLYLERLGESPDDLVSDTQHVVLSDDGHLSKGHKQFYTVPPATFGVVLSDEDPAYDPLEVLRNTPYNTPQIRPMIKETLFKLHEEFSSYRQIDLSKESIHNMRTIARVYERLLSSGIEATGFGKVECIFDFRHWTKKKDGVSDKEIKLLAFNYRVDDLTVCRYANNANWLSFRLNRYLDEQNCEKYSLAGLSRIETRMTEIPTSGGGLAHKPVPLNDSEVLKIYWDHVVKLKKDLLPYRERLNSASGWTAPDLLIEATEKAICRDIQAKRPGTKCQVRLQATFWSPAETFEPVSVKPVFWSSLQPAVGLVAR